MSQSIKNQLKIIVKQDSLHALDGDLKCSFALLKEYEGLIPEEYRDRAGIDVESGDDFVPPSMTIYYYRIETDIEARERIIENVSDLTSEMHLCQIAIESFNKQLEELPAVTPVKQSTTILGEKKC